MKTDPFILKQNNMKHLDQITVIALEAKKAGKLIPLIEMLPEDMQENAVRWALGILNTEIPTKAVYGDTTYQLKDYNWLTGKVFYTYNYSVTSYFETEDAAKLFAEQGYPSGVTLPDEIFRYAGTRIYNLEGDTTIKDWENHA